MKTPLNIALYVGLWPHNIGNAFLGLGAEAIIRQAFPDAAVFRTGCAGHWMFSHGQDHIKKNFFGYPKIKKAPDYIHNSLELAQVADVDLVVVPGMCLAKEFIATSGKTLLHLAQRKIPVLFLGAGPDRSVLVNRQPFPGSGLASRIMADVTAERLDILREADDIFRHDVEDSNQNKRLWQYFAALALSPFPDGGYVVTLRAVQTAEGAAGNTARFTADLLERVTAHILAQCPKVQRVFYDLTPSKSYKRANL